jgi:putative holliday junction resolvase
MKRRVAAVDYGKKRIGLALSDTSGTIALPLAVVPSGKHQKEGIHNILRILSPRLHEIRLWVVGNPLLLNGTVGEMAQAAHRFAALLHAESHIEVQLLDERLSSRAVERMQLEAGLRRQQRKKTSDAIVATLLLDTYLQSDRLRTSENVYIETT